MKRSVARVTLLIVKIIVKEGVYIELIAAIVKNVIYFFNNLNIINEIIILNYYSLHCIIDNYNRLCFYINLT